MIHPIENWRTYDDNGVMMPWYTRPCLEWLDTLPRLPDMKVWEYGCGVSSLWFKSRCRIVDGVDMDKKWIFNAGIQYEATTEKEYLEMIFNGDRRYHHCIYDVIVVDGHFRDQCAEYALPFLSKGGYLICDNFEQPSADLAHWPKTRELTKNLPLTIYKEPSHPDWQTAVFHNI